MSDYVIVFCSILLFRFGLLIWWNVVQCHSPHRAMHGTPAAKLVAMRPLRDEEQHSEPRGGKTRSSRLVTIVCATYTNSGQSDSVDSVCPRDDTVGVIRKPWALRGVTTVQFAALSLLSDTKVCPHHLDGYARRYTKHIIIVLIH